MPAEVEAGAGESVLLPWSGSAASEAGPSAGTANGNTVPPDGLDTRIMQALEAAQEHAEHVSSSQAVTVTNGNVDIYSEEDEGQDDLSDSGLIQQNQLHMLLTKKQQQVSHLREEIASKKLKLPEFVLQMNSLMQCHLGHEHNLQDRIAALTEEKRQLESICEQQGKEHQMLQAQLDEMLVYRQSCETRVQFLMDLLVSLLSNGVEGEGATGLVDDVLSDGADREERNKQRLGLFSRQLEDVRQENRTLAQRLSQIFSSTTAVHDKLCARQSELFSKRSNNSFTPVLPASASAGFPDIVEQDSSADGSSMADALLSTSGMWEPSSPSAFATLASSASASVGGSRPARALAKFEDVGVGGHSPGQVHVMTLEDSQALSLAKLLSDAAQLQSPPRRAGAFSYLESSGVGGRGTESVGVGVSTSSTHSADPGATAAAAVKEAGVSAGPAVAPLPGPALGGAGGLRGEVQDAGVQSQQQQQQQQQQVQLLSQIPQPQMQPQQVQQEQRGQQQKQKQPQPQQLQQQPQLGQQRQQQQQPHPVQQLRDPDHVPPNPEETLMTRSNGSPLRSLVTGKAPVPSAKEAYNSWKSLASIHADEVNRRMKRDPGNGKPNGEVPPGRTGPPSRDMIPNLTMLERKLRDALLEVAFDRPVVRIAGNPGIYRFGDDICALVTLTAEGDLIVQRSEHPDSPELLDTSSPQPVAIFLQEIRSERAAGTPGSCSAAAAGSSSSARAPAPGEAFSGRRPTSPECLGRRSLPPGAGSAPCPGAAAPSQLQAASTQTTQIAGDRSASVPISAGVSSLQGGRAIRPASAGRVHAAAATPPSLIGRRRMAGRETLPTTNECRSPGAGCTVAAARVATGSASTDRPKEPGRLSPQSSAGPSRVPIRSARATPVAGAEVLPTPVQTPPPPSRVVGGQPMAKSPPPQHAQALWMRNATSSSSFASPCKAYGMAPCPVAPGPPQLLAPARSSAPAALRTWSVEDLSEGSPRAKSPGASIVDNSKLKQPPRLLQSVPSNAALPSSLSAPVAVPAQGSPLPKAMMQSPAVRMHCGASGSFHPGNLGSGSYGSGNYAAATSAGSALFSSPRRQTLGQPAGARCSPPPRNPMQPVTVVKAVGESRSYSPQSRSPGRSTSVPAAPQPVYQQAVGLSGAASYGGPGAVTSRSTIRSPSRVSATAPPAGGPALAGAYAVQAMCCSRQPQEVTGSQQALERS